MKKFLAVLLLLSLFLSFSACSRENDAKIPVKVMIPKGTPQVALIGMIKNTPEFEGYEVSFVYPNSNDLLSGAFLNNEAEIILAPTNLGAIVYNKGASYRLHGVIIWGSLYLVSSANISSLAELSGKEILSTGKGLTTDVLLQYLLRANGVEDIKMKYASAATELMPLFLEGQEVALMPEPTLSMLRTKKQDVFIAMDFQTEWKKVTGLDTGYPQAAVFVNSDFSKENKKFVEKFMAECEKTAQWVNDNPETAGEYFTELEPGLPAAVIAASVPGSNIAFMDASASLPALQKYFELLLEDNPANIGGKLPDEAFYYKE